VPSWSSEEERWSKEQVSELQSKYDKEVALHNKAKEQLEGARKRIRELEQAAEGETGKHIAQYGQAIQWANTSLDKVSAMAQAVANGEATQQQLVEAITQVQHGLWNAHSQAANQYQFQAWNRAQIRTRALEIAYANALEHWQADQLQRAASPQEQDAMLNQWMGTGNNSALEAKLTETEKTVEELQRQLRKLSGQSHVPLGGTGRSAPAGKPKPEDYIGQPYEYEKAKEHWEASRRRG
jgi:hypothetical protein